jgi:hypothetical protein
VSESEQSYKAGNFIEAMIAIAASSGIRSLYWKIRSLVASEVRVGQAFQQADQVPQIILHEVGEGSCLQGRLA